MQGRGTMMRAHPRWPGLGLVVLCTILAGCSSSATGTARRQASAAATAPQPTATAPQPTATATPRRVVANVYYRTSDQSVYALNPADGAVRWTFSRGQGVYDPIVAGSLVYVEVVGQSNAYTLYALDGATGAVAWSAPGGAYPTVANGAIYVLVGQTLDCLDAGTGTLRWQRQAEAGYLTITDDTVYVEHATVTSTGAATSSSLTAFNSSDGAMRWTFARTHEGFGHPVVGAGVVYFVATSQPPNPPSGQLYALKATDGSQLWSANAPAIANGFELAGGVLYAGGSTTGISAYRASDGAPLWKNADPLLSRFTPAGNAVYVNAFHGTVVALDATTGKQLWAATVGGPGYAPIAIVANGVLYAVAGRGSGALVAIDVSTGAIAWQQQMAGTPGSPVVATARCTHIVSSPTTGRVRSSMPSTPPMAATCGSTRRAKTWRRRWR
jgi:outer membrane protein assembly factor BamB